MSLSTMYSAGVAMVRSAGSRIMATSTRTKVIAGIVAVNALGMRSANRIAKTRTKGSGIARSAKIAAKTVLGLSYVVGTGFVDGWNKAKKEAKKEAKRKPSVKKAKRKAVKKAAPKKARKVARKVTRKVTSKKTTAKFNRTALNRALNAQIKPGMSVDQMRKTGLALLRKHNAPASYRKEFLAGMRMVQAEVRKMAKDSVLHSATAPASANKFTAKRKYTKRTPAAAPVVAEKQK